MATVREKGKQTWRETCLQLQRRQEGGRDSPTLRSARSAPVGPQGWVVLQSAPPLRFTGGGHRLFMGKVTPPPLW